VQPWLKWVLVLPAAIGAGVGVQLIVVLNALAARQWFDTDLSYVGQFASALLCPAAFVSAGSSVAAAYRHITSICLTIFVAILQTAIVTWAIIENRETTSGLAWLIICAIAGIVACVRECLRSHSASTRRCASSFCACVYLVVGALLSALFFQIGCSHSTSPFGKSQTLSPVELFQKVSPSVFVVEALDENGKNLMLGSGVAIARDFLITNCHVVQSSSSLRVSQGKQHWTARLIQAVPSHDLCELRPGASGQIATSVNEQGRIIFTTDDKPAELSPVSIRPSRTLVTGERVYAIGAPEGLELTFSEGVISALRETEVPEWSPSATSVRANPVRMIQTSAPISPGSSGGGLFDAQGNLVGVTTFYLKEGQSLNFALPGEWVSGMLSSSTEAGAKSSTHLSDVELESRAWLEIGLEAVKKEEYDLAVHSFRKCADLKQSDAARAWFELGKVFSLSESTSDAYKAWLCSTASREAKCDSSGGFFLRLTIQEKEIKAITAFEKAIELKPDYAEAWRELASAHLSMESTFLPPGDQAREEFGQAISAAKEYTRLAPGDWEGWENLGAYYFDIESYAEAIDAWQKEEKVAPDGKKSIILVLVGMAYAKKGDREQVLRIYQELKGRDPKLAAAFFRRNVLPKAEATAQPKKMSQRDQLLRILRNAPIDDATRQDAWDTFYQASSPDDFIARIDKLNIPDTVKRSIYDLRFRKP